MHLTFFGVPAEQGLQFQVPCKTTTTQRNATIRKLSTTHYEALKIGE